MLPLLAGQKHAAESPINTPACRQSRMKGGAWTVTERSAHDVLPVSPAVLRFPETIGPVCSRLLSFRRSKAQRQICWSVTAPHKPVASRFEWKRPTSSCEFVGQCHRPARTKRRAQTGAEPSDTAVRSARSAKRSGGSPKMKW